MRASQNGDRIIVDEYLHYVRGFARIAGIVPPRPTPVSTPTPVPTPAAVRDWEWFATVFSGDRIKLLSRSGQWYKVQYGRLVGWVEEVNIKNYCR